MTAILAVLLLYQASSMSVSSPAFPAAFHGVWDISPVACSGQHSTIRIQIEADQISYWESTGRPIEMFSAGEHDVFVTLAMSGEGETWQSRIRFVRDGSGERLFAEDLPVVGRDFFDTNWFYHRCPNGTPMGYVDR